MPVPAAPRGPATLGCAAGELSIRHLWVAPVPPLPAKPCDLQLRCRGGSRCATNCGHEAAARKVQRRRRNQAGALRWAPSAERCRVLRFPPWAEPPVLLGKGSAGSTGRTAGCHYSPSSSSVQGGHGSPNSLARTAPIRAVWK